MDNKCNRCGITLPETEAEDNICRECAWKEWEEILKEHDQEIPLTQKELDQLEHSSIILTQYHDLFDYGRAKEKKMAESL